MIRRSSEAFAGLAKQHDQALLIVDQFEELFTQNTEEEQARYAEVLGQIAMDADVRILLSMRDDFFDPVQPPFEVLRPVFSELTVLDPPCGSALRRAVVQPALRCGYRFEDEELADEILADVEGERGALPLLAFALARLWEKRDRENGLITRQAYKDIGGVGGALAGHAEELMERLGSGAAARRAGDLQKSRDRAGHPGGAGQRRAVVGVSGPSPGEKPPGRKGILPDCGQGVHTRRSDADEVLTGPHRCTLADIVRGAVAKTVPENSGSR